MHFKILLVVLLSVLSLQIWCGIVDDERNKTLAEVIEFYSFWRKFTIIAKNF